MLAALDIRLVGGESEALHILLLIVGPALISGAAVFAARTARDSAAERQEKQLAHDSERQEEALAHDREMREQELAHDREVRRTERARDLLDSALEKLHHARMDTTAFVAQILGTQEERSDLESALEEDPELPQRTALEQKLAKRRTDLRSASTKALNAQLALNADWIRLLLRFGHDHSISRTYKAAMDLMGEVRQSCDPGIDRPLSDNEQEQGKELSAEIGSRLGDFTLACRQWDDS